jgi:hypothetical protein
MIEPFGVLPADELTDPRPAVVLETLAAIQARARRYLQEPDDGAWHDLVDALERAHGDGATYELLRAVEIHYRIGPR